jgi:hypothetical protein
LLLLAVDNGKSVFLSAMEVAFENSFCCCLGEADDDDDDAESLREKRERIDEIEEEATAGCSILASVLALLFLLSLADVGRGKLCDDRDLNARRIAKRTTNAQRTERLKTLLYFKEANLCTLIVKRCSAWVSLRMRRDSLGFRLEGNESFFSLLF